MASRRPNLAIDVPQRTMNRENSFTFTNEGGMLHPDACLVPLTNILPALFPPQTAAVVLESIRRCAADWWLWLSGPCLT